jgi:hypothetical protein
MILSVSRRTDIPSYYSDWFYNRIKEGFVLVRNPMNIHQVSKIQISPEVVDCIVFWTKNPLPMLARLGELKEYPYYFQFTLNSYGQDVEEHVPFKGIQGVETFKRLSDQIGRQRVIWRYDPILLNEKYNIEYHLYYFEKLAANLHEYTEKCTISFIDFYRNINANVRNLELHVIGAEEKRALAAKLIEIANFYHLKMDTCAEDIELSNLGMQHARCIDAQLIEKILGGKMKVEKDRNQRLVCGCVESVDIGMYNTCVNGCRYCYANHSRKTAEKNFKQHDKQAPLLCGIVTGSDIVKVRAMKSLKEEQADLFYESKSTV